MYNRKVTSRDLLRLVGSVSLLWLVFGLLLVFGCSKYHDHPNTPDDEHAPPDTVVVIDTLIITTVDTVFVSCDTVDLTVQFTVIGDQSAPNEYAYFLNGQEVGRFVVSETYAEPTEIYFDVVFERVSFGDVISIKKISGSRAEAIGSAIINIKCS